jgi:hypothetical protein
MGIVGAVAAAAILAALHLNGSSPSQNQETPSLADTTTAPPVNNITAPASSTVLLTSPPPAASSASPNGTQLAKYSFDLPNEYWAPLGLTAPTRAQLTNQSQLDIQYNGELYFRSNEQILALPNSSVPTYPACAHNNQIENGGLGLSAVRGTAFCVVESGTIAGVEVGSVNNNPAYVVLNVTIWQNT